MDQTKPTKSRYDIGNHLYCVRLGKTEGVTCPLCRQLIDRTVVTRWEVKPFEVTRKQWGDGYTRGWVYGARGAENGTAMAKDLFDYEKQAQAEADKRNEIEEQ